MIRRPCILGSLATILVFGLPLAAQSLQTGAIAGTVRDPSGKPVKGITVRAESGQTRSVQTTSESGEFRFPLLLPGTWEVTVHGTGWQTVRGTFRVGSGSTQNANFKLTPIQTAVVEVLGSVQNIDVTSSQTSINLDADLISSLPKDLTNSNGLQGVLASLPGINVYAGNDTSYYIGGGSHDQNLFTVDGTITNLTSNNQGSKTVSSQPAMEFIESVEVVTGGFGAEYNVLGGAINVNTKSGTNTFAGEVFGYTNFPNQAAVGKYNTRTTPPMYPPGLADKYVRYGFAFGGPIIKDELFFFIGYQGFHDRLPPTQGGINWNGLASATATQEGPNLTTLKVNWIINQSNQLILSSTDTKRVDHMGAQYPGSTMWQAGTLDMGQISTYRSESTSLTWNWLISPTMTLVTSAANFTNPTHIRPNTGGSGGMSTSIWDSRYWVTGPGRSAAQKPDGYDYWYYITGDGYLPQQDSWNPNRQIRFDFTWSPGNHTIKAGILRSDTRNEIAQGARRFFYLYTPANNGSPIGDPDALEMYQVDAYKSVIKGRMTSYYIKDQWEVTKGLRLELGARYDPFRFTGGAGPFDGVELGRFESLEHQFQPRLGVTWDVRNDGKTKFYANWGRSFQTMPLQSVSWASVSSSSDQFWTADHFTYNPDYTGSTAPFTILNDPSTRAPYAPDVVFTYGNYGKPSPRATDIRLPHKDLLVIGWDQEFTPNWTSGASWRFSETRNALDKSYFTNDDGSPAFPGVREKVLWNPRPGPVTFVDSDGNERTWESRFPTPVDRFISLNLHGRYQDSATLLSLDYTWIHHYGNYRGISPNFMTYQTGSSVPVGSTNDTNEFNFYRTIASGNFENNPTHEVKLHGNRTFKVLEQEVSVGLVCTWSSGLGLSKGIPIGVLYPNYVGGSWQAIQPDNQRGDMGRLPSVLNLDFNLSGRIRIGKCTLKPVFSMTNLLNRRTATGYYTSLVRGYSAASATPDPNFGMENAWQSGRAFTAGASLSF